MIGQVGFWDEMNTMQELHTSSCDSIGCICFHQNESEVNLTMDLLKTTSMKAMSLGVACKSKSTSTFATKVFLYVNVEHVYSCLPLEAYDENNIWSIHNHLIFIPFVILHVSCSSLFLDVLAPIQNNKFWQNLTTRIRNNDGWRRMMDPRLLRCLRNLRSTKPKAHNFQSGPMRPVGNYQVKVVSKPSSSNTRNSEVRFGNYPEGSTGRSGRHYGFGDDRLGTCA